MRTLAALAAICILVPACAQLPVDKIKMTSSVLTAGGEGERFKRVPSKTFKQEDRIVYFANFTWENIDSGAGTHAVQWTWYANEKPVSKIKQNANFHTTPFEIWSHIPASVLGTGKHRLDVTIDEKAFDSKEFEVIN